MKIIVGSMTITRTTVSATGLSTAPVRPRGTVRIHIDTKAPNMNTSPWAKLMSSMIP